MITGFEDITHELTQQELDLVPVLVQGFEKRTVDNPIKAPEIVARMNIYLQNRGVKLKFTEARLRKCCNYIRSCGILPLVATSNGYFVSQDPEVLLDQIRSLQERAASIKRCADGLRKFVDINTKQAELFNDNPMKRHKYG